MALGELSSRSLECSWDSLGRVQRLSIFAGLALFWLLVLSLVLYTFMARSDGAFLVDVRTEYVEYRPGGDRPPRLYLGHSQLFSPGSGCGDGAQGGDGLSIAGGSIEIAKSSQLVFSRIADRSVNILIRGEQGHRFYDEFDDYRCFLGPVIEVTLGAMERAAASFDGFYYPLVGDIVVGRSPGFDPNAELGMLLSGDVRLLARQIVSGDPYFVGPFTLQLGDELDVVSEAGVPSSGFITIDEGPGFRVIFSANATTVTVRKFKLDPVAVENGAWSRLRNDDELVMAWGGGLVLWSLLRILVVTLVSNKGHESRSQEGRTGESS